MKKILSICLAALLLASSVPMAYATEESSTVGENADVEQQATGSDAYTIKVPALLAPGESGTVTLQGTWASDCVIIISADKDVLLTNDIEATEQKTLNVSFPGIDEYGSDTTSQTFTETISVEGMTDVLFGTWSGSFVYHVKVVNPDNMIEHLQSVYPFKYYSTINLAVSDVNSGRIGTKADSDKENAVAGIYTDDNDNVNVVLLKDTELSEGIVTKKDMIINLGGRTISATDVNAIDQISGKLVVDGRLSGSIILVNDTISDDVYSLPVQIREHGVELTVNGGTYISNAEKSNSACIDVRTGTASINDAEITATDTTGIARAIRVLSVASASVKNCECSASSTAGEAVGIFAQGNATIESSGIAATGSVKALGVEIASTTTVKDSNISVDRETATSGDTFGIYVRNSDKAVGNATITNNNITVSGGKKAVGIRIAIEQNTIPTGATAIVTDGDITASGAPTTYGIEVTEETIATVTNSTVRSYTTTLASSGIYNDGTLTVNDAHVTGVHSGIRNHGSLNVNGGTYEGYGYGGLYFINDESPAYIRNAATGHCAMTDAGISSQGSGIYLGSKGYNGIVVYMDNCDIYGDVQPIMLYGASGEESTLYISNSSINRGGYSGNGIRNNSFSRTYLGVGNNFTAADAKTPSAVISTGETYAQ